MVTNSHLLRETLQELALSPSYSFPQTTPWRGDQCDYPKKPRERLLRHFSCNLQFFTLTHLISRRWVYWGTRDPKSVLFDRIFSCTAEKLLRKDTIMHNNVFSLLTFPPNIAALLSFNWGLFFSFKLSAEGKWERLIFLFHNWRKQPRAMLRAHVQQGSLQKRLRFCHERQFSV